MKTLSRTVLTLFILTAFAAMTSLSAQTILSPVADTDLQSDVPAGTNSTLHASQWCHLFIKFDLSSLSGSVTDARLRLHKNTATSGLVLYINTTSNDTWSEGSALPSTASQITSLPAANGTGYVEVDLTSYIQTRMAANQTASVSITTNAGTWTAFNSREASSNTPQLVVTTSGGGGGSNPSITGTVQAEEYTSMSGVATEGTSDSGGGQNVGWIENNDWMRYEINIPAAGTYTVNYRIAGFGGSLRLESPGGGTVYGTLNIPSTGGWQTWTTISHDVVLPAGDHPLVIRATSSGWNLNWWGQATAVGGGGDPYTTITNTIQAEDYSGMSGVATESTGDSGGGQNVGYIDTNDWMQYNVTVPSAGDYVVRYRVASPGGASLRLESPGGGTVYGTLNIPATGGWQNWTTISHTVALPAGDRQLVIRATSGGWNINWWGQATSDGGGTPSDGWMATNFWFLADWSGESPYVPGVNFSNAWNSGKTGGVVNTNIWNPVFLDEIEVYSTLRFMDWGGVNGSDDDTWSDRKLPESPENTWAWGGEPGVGDGLAYEWMIDLCNRLNKNMWVCIPHRADLDYSFQLATLIRNNLNPGLKCYVEYSNETWNFGFPQAAYCRDQGVALGLHSDQYTAGFMYHPYIALRHFREFDQVFAGQSNRIVKVLAGQEGNTWLTQLHIDVMNDNSLNPWNVEADAYATAPYFGHDVHGSDPDAISELQSSIDEKVATAGAVRNVVVAAGLSNIAYEGGQHVYQGGADDISRNPQMYNLYMDYFTRMEPLYDLFAHYAHCGNYSDGGAWGAKEYTGQPVSEAHKYRAIVDFVNQTGATFMVVSAEESRQLEAFPNPVTGGVVHIPSGQKAVHAELYDSFGQKVLHRTIDVSGETADLNVSGVKPGLYLLKVRLGANYYQKRLLLE